MPFGLTYATFVAGIGLSMVLGPVDPTAPRSSHALTFGTTTNSGYVGDEDFLTFTHISDQVIWNRFHPIYAVGLSDQNTAFISAGLGRRLDVFGVKVMPFTGPTLYFDKKNNDVIQFRTGFEITQDLTDTLSLTGGYYHISNAQANAPSADIDVAHLGLRMRF